MIWGEITVLEFLVMSFYNYAKVLAVLSKHCGKNNGESQYFVKINQILMVR